MMRFFKRILDRFYALPEELRPKADYLINDLDIIDKALLGKDIY